MASSDDAHHSPYIFAPPRTVGELMRYFSAILGPESSFYWLAIIYGIGISLLSLATPISVQMLINTVANSGLTTPLIVLSFTLFGLLLVAVLLNALRIHLMELFSRRFYARMVSDIALRSIYALNPFFADQGRGTLHNRYFDIVIVTKRVPALLVGGFTLLLQSVVGFVLVSLYHPYFLIFNMLVLGLLYIVWLIWGRRSIKSALDLSHKKHATAGWLEALGESNGFYKKQSHVDKALDETDAYTGQYIKQQKVHFGHTYGQTLALLLIYATASATLLGLGGWLVIQSQLSIGQLVAAELVLSVVFVGVSQLGTYLTYFYDLCAAIDELSLFHDTALEDPPGVGEPLPEFCSLSFQRACGEARGRPTEFNLAIEAGTWVLAVAQNYSIQRLFSNLLRRHEEPQSGMVTYGGVDITAIAAHELRQEVIVLDKPQIVSMTVREYLEICLGRQDNKRIREAIALVGLEDTVAELNEGLDTLLMSTGWPLSIAETMQLKLAGALLSEPEMLVLNQLYDVLTDEVLERSLATLRQPGQKNKTTVVYFTNNRSHLRFDSYLYLGATEQHQLKSYAEMRRVAEERSLDEEGAVPRPVKPLGARA
ncbi:MAG: ABC transporter ATP-binding protein [Pseudomonadota bacterium]